MIILSHKYVHEREKKERKERTSKDENSFSTHSHQNTFNSLLYFFILHFLLFSAFFRHVQYNSIDNLLQRDY